MRAFWVLTLGLVALTAAEGCKRHEPEPIPGPKAVAAAAVGQTRAAGIAWFQGSLDEAFARPSVHVTCATGRAPMAPLAPLAPLPPDLSRTRNRLNSPSPTGCRSGTCRTGASPRRPLV